MTIIKNFLVSIFIFLANKIVKSNHLAHLSFHLYTCLFYSTKDRLKVWARKNLSDTNLKYMIERLNLLDDELPLAFTKDSSVYIG